MNDIKSLREEVKEIAKKAIENDDKKNFEEACKFYIKAAELLQKMIKIDENPNNRTVYKNRAMEYCQRAQMLKSEIESGTKSEEKKEEKKAEEKKEEKKTEDKKEDSKEDAETKKLMESLSGCVVTEKPNVKWSDVAGLEKAKEALQEAVILPLRFPQLFTGKRKPWKGILLYGPPGTGKSYLAKACATEAKGTFFSLSASNIISKWMGESERLVKALFDLARKTNPAIIFIDEIDSLMSARSDGENESTRRVKTEFLVQMQGVGKDDKGILVLGATNIPWGLDPAVRRRFQKKIYLGLPDIEARKFMLKHNLGKTNHNIADEDFEELASRCEGYIITLFI
jgi:vacuolar protein-sorting-associated protein 4